jgi:hypothetical protein
MTDTRRYAPGEFAPDDARALHGQIVTIITHDDPITGDLGYIYPGVEVYYPGGHQYLLVAHRDDETPVAVIYLEVIQSVKAIT